MRARMGGVHGALPNILIALAVLALILTRQLTPKQIREDQPYRLMLILGVIGVVELVKATEGEHVPAGAWAIVAVSIAIGAAIGYLRGLLVHVWRDPATGVLMRQGNATTVALWLVSLALHLGIDLLVRHVAHGPGWLGSTSLLLYLAIALAAQRLATVRRGAEIAHATA